MALTHFNAENVGQVAKMLGHGFEINLDRLRVLEAFPHQEVKVVHRFDIRATEREDLDVRKLVVLGIQSASLIVGARSTKTIATEREAEAGIQKYVSEFDRKSLAHNWANSCRMLFMAARILRLSTRSAGFHMRLRHPTFFVAGWEDHGTAETAGETAHCPNGENG
jgi:hypothetical protein